MRRAINPPTFLKHLCWIVVFIFSCLECNAQLSLTTPTSRIVYQRSNANTATIPIAGHCLPNATRIEARMIARQGGISTSWTTIDPNPANGIFRGSLPNIQGGWYNLEVRSWANETPQESTSIERIGVGEVFVTAGQSNSYGSNWDTGIATDDRVSVANYWGGGAGQIDEASLPLTFSQAGRDPSGLGGTVSAAPAAPLFMWGALGDKLVQKLGVPVLFFGAGYGGSNSSLWRQAAEGQEKPGNYVNNAPYRGLGTSILHYLKRTGVRAVLWHQGESDNNAQTLQGYMDNLNAVIQKSRSQSGFSHLSWVIAQASYIPAQYGSQYVNHETDPAIIAAQAALAKGINCWQGPYTDPYRYPDFRKDDQLHFTGADCQFLANLWSERLSEDFFTQIQPSQPQYFPTITTGYIFPFTPTSGQTISVPFRSTAAVRTDNVYQVALCTETGEQVAILGQTTSNRVSVLLPPGLNGRYRIRISATSPVTIGELSEPITVSDSGSTTPSNPTVSGAHEGFVDGANCDQVVGWVWDANRPDEPLQVEVLANGQVIATGTANQYRMDLQQAGKGNGIHGYSIALPNTAKTGASVTLTVRVQGTTYLLTNPTAPVTCPGSGTAITPINVAPIGPSVSLRLIEPDYNCQTGVFSFRSEGGVGEIRYMAPGITGWTSYAGPYTVMPAPDAQPFTLFAQLGSETVEYRWNWKTACTSAPSNTPSVPDQGDATRLPLTLLAPNYNCQTGTFTFRITGGDSSPIAYMGAGITGWTNSAGPLIVRPDRDVEPFTLFARQSGQVVSYRWDYLAVCSPGNARQATSPEENMLTLQVYPNPTTGPVTIETNAREGEIWLVMMDGRVVGKYALKTQSNSTHTLNLYAFPAGSYYISLRSAKTNQSIRLQKM